MTHAQSFAKVNVPVDHGVAGIVSALSEFPGLETVESCEAAGIGGGPWVCFRYGAYWEHPWRDLAEFVLGSLGPALRSQVGDDIALSIVTTPSGSVFADLNVRPGAAARTEEALRLIAERLPLDHPLP